MIADLIRYTCAVGAVAIVGIVVGVSMVYAERDRRAQYLRSRMPPHHQDLMDRFYSDFPKEADQQVILEVLRKMYRRQAKS